MCECAHVDQPPAREEEEEDGEGEWWSEAAEDGGQADGGERWADADEWNGWASSTTPLAQRGWSIADETACPARPARGCGGAHARSASCVSPRSFGGGVP